VCREPNKKTLSNEGIAESLLFSYRHRKTLGKQASLPRAKQKALGTEKTLAKDFFTKSQLVGSLQRISLPSAIF
jgi:hypothetical protein